MMTPTEARSAAAQIAVSMDQACALIAPTWPLDRFIAVNPLWSRVDKTLPVVSAELAALSGARLVMPRAWFAQEMREGRLRDVHLQKAIEQSDSDMTVAQLKALLGQEETTPNQSARVMDVLDAHCAKPRELSHRDFVIHSTSQFCASYFDQGQAQLTPNRTQGLYTAWRQQALGDRNPGWQMGLATYAARAKSLPATPQDMAMLALSELGIPQGAYASYLTGLLLDLNGWASYCAYLRWTARLSGGDDNHILELLGVRLAWEWLLFKECGPRGVAHWHAGLGFGPTLELEAKAAQAENWVFQRALEIAYQDALCAQLPAGLARGRPASASVQAAFCIDVRSEVFRRALEATDPSVQTLGFAGFFGLPIEYQPIESHDARPQLPGLLAAQMRVSDTGVTPQRAARRTTELSLNSIWKRFKTSPLSSFSFVEALGLLSAGKLVEDGFGRSHAAEDDGRNPRLACHVGGPPISTDERCKLAGGILRAMGLTQDFARLVVMVGHGSATRNNPHAAGLDCGACCGQTGEVNARAAAALLNEPGVRAGLASQGIGIPESTRFIGALHNTTLDSVTLFELDELPPSHLEGVMALKQTLAATGKRARRERAPKLGLANLDDAQLEAAVRDRASDWAQVRPEWGLANNASFIVAPREHSQHLDLAGRSFLHDYRWESDDGFAILELIMTAPMVVTHWINLQYYASTVDNQRYGSGNKVLHNVVGGHLGVFEGNGGDLRIGLPIQSLHDGERWMHAPLRLSVFIEAPSSAIEGILAKHDKVRALVDNEWIHLFQIDANTSAVLARRKGRWVTTAHAVCPETKAH